MTGPLIVDVDTGVDDALALALLTRRNPGLLAVTTVAGNAGIDDATENTLRVLAWLGQSEIPVHRGASRPLSIPNRVAADVHGDNGLGNVVLPASNRSEANGNAIETILNLAERHVGDLTVLTLGPMTNLAIALSLRPRLVDQVRRVVVMGGAYFNPGNTTPFAEFNVLVDPDAASQVFNAGWQELIALGLDVTHQTTISRATWDSIPEDASPPAILAKRILARSFTERKLDGFFLHDPLAALMTIESEIIGTDRGSIEVELDGPRIGKTTFTAGDGPIAVATLVDAETAERGICEALGIAWMGNAAARQNAE
jgi:inosine-uridine nucleoside N-ribohydrolase